jgi:hypothetical protein
VTNAFRPRSRLFRGGSSSTPAVGHPVVCPDTMKPFAFIDKSMSRLLDRESRRRFAELLHLVAGQITN